MLISVGQVLLLLLSKFTGTLKSYEVTFQGVLTDPVFRISILKNL
jgi:hypothetical protein